MCILCAACNNPFRALGFAVSAAALIDSYYLCWLGVFTVSMSFMDHRRDAGASAKGLELHEQ